MEVYIYALTDPRTGEVRYIGKTVNLKQRMWLHLGPRHLARNRGHCANWIRELLAEGLKPIPVIVEVADEATWEDAEQRQLRIHREQGCDLTNITLGGFGLLGVKRGPKPQAEREKLRRAMLGKHHTPETRAKISAIQTGRKYPPEFGEAISQRKKGIRMGPEFGAKVSAAKRGKKQSEAAKLKRRKIPNEQVPIIRERVAAGGCAVAIARELGVTPSLINQIASGRARTDCAGPITRTDRRAWRPYSSAEAEAAAKHRLL